MNNEVSVDTGEVKARGGDEILRASAIGSCVVVAAHDAASRVGGMAHVMLPGASGDRASGGKTKYAEDAAAEMIRQMARLGARHHRVRACLIGGANVLGDGHDTPGPQVVQSLTETLRRQGIAVVATEVGGTQRRSCSLELASGRVTYTVGDSEPRLLWQGQLWAPGPEAQDRRTAAHALAEGAA